MTKLIALLITLLITPSAFAHGGHGYGHYGNYHGGYGRWVAPLVVGGVVGYELSKPIAPALPVVIYQDIPVGYHQEIIRDASCNCLRNVLVRN